MATNPFELYVLISPIAAAFAGFGSLASGLGQRMGGDHARVDAMRFASMLSASLSATMLALMPATIAGFLADGQLAVRVAALIAVITILGFAPISMKRAFKIRGLPGFSKAGVVANTAFTLVALGAFALCLLNKPVGREAALYLLGLVSLLGSSVVMFSRVIASMLRPINDPRDAD